MGVVGQAGDGLEVLTLARNLHPDLVVMDIEDAVYDDWKQLGGSRRIPCAVRILMLTIHDEDEKLFAGIKAGANGYLLEILHALIFYTACAACWPAKPYCPHVWRPISWMSLPVWPMRPKQS